MIDDDKSIYVTDDTIYRNAVEHGVNDWRKTELDIPPAGSAERIAITQGGNTIEAVKGDGQWSFAAPLSGRVDADKVKDLLSAAGLFRVNKFTTDDPAKLAE